MEERNQHNLTFFSCGLGFAQVWFIRVAAHRAQGENHRARQGEEREGSKGRNMNDATRTTIDRSWVEVFLFLIEIGCFFLS